jgi:serine/threonine protein phosphatase 1
MITQTLAPASLPPGQRIYAVGDVHGCADRLGAMHAAIAKHLADQPVDDSDQLTVAAARGSHQHALS